MRIQRFLRSGINFISLKFHKVTSLTQLPDASVSEVILLVLKKIINSWLAEFFCGLYCLY